MNNRADCCGKFRKEEDLVVLAGDSDDCGNYEEWTECKFCCSQSDFDTYFKRDSCPLCRSDLISKWSGVKCSKCDYWFCY